MFSFIRKLSLDFKEKSFNKDLFINYQVIDNYQIIVIFFNLSSLVFSIAKTHFLKLESIVTIYAEQKHNMANFINISE